MTRRFLAGRGAAVLVVALALAGVALAAGPDLVLQSIDAARAAWKKKDAAASVRALEQALAAARVQAPLEIRRAVVVHAPHTGLGLYSPAPDDVVVGRDLRLYVEVASYGTAAAEGGESAALDVEGEFSYEDAGELVPLGKKSLGTQRFFSRSSIGITSFGVDVKLGDKSPAGVYRMTLRVQDTIGNKSASRELRFVLR